MLQEQGQFDELAVVLLVRPGGRRVGAGLQDGGEAAADGGEQRGAVGQAAFVEQVAQGDAAAGERGGEQGGPPGVVDADQGVQGVADEHGPGRLLVGERVRLCGGAGGEGVGGEAGGREDVVDREGRCGADRGSGVVDRAGQERGQGGACGPLGDAAAVGGGDSGGAVPQQGVEHRRHGPHVGDAEGDVAEHAAVRPVPGSFDGFPVPPAVDDRAAGFLRPGQAVPGDGPRRSGAGRGGAVGGEFAGQPGAAALWGEPSDGRGDACERRGRGLDPAAFP